MNQGDNLPPEIFQNKSSSFCSGANDSAFDDAKKTYNEMMLKSTVLTNSEFSRRAIQNHFGMDSTVLHPPVDVDTFRDAALSSNVRDNSILVVSRFHPSKNISNAIHLARMLKQNGVGKFVKIVGNVSPKQLYYLSYLKGLVKKYHVENFVSFEINVKFERLLELMRRAKVYFHAMRGEPFGISIVEAMSSGLIPVVPDLGGPTEFVPEKYQFRRFGQAVEAVAQALDAPASERHRLSDSTKKYSISNYATKFALIMAERFEIGRALKTAPVVVDPKSHSEKPIETRSGKSTRFP
jgi:glycosyltransferase involved in cell wall biosynthesis